MVPSLNKTNYLNLAGFLLLVLFVEEDKSNYNRYNYVLTPRDFFLDVTTTFLISFQGMFGITQMLPRYRDDPIVQSVQHWFFVACAAQTLGMMLPLAGVFLDFICMVVSLYSLVKVILNQEQHVRGENYNEKYWLLRFVFPFYCAVTIMKCFMTFNGVLDWVGVRGIELFAIGLGLLLSLVVLAGYVLFFSPIAPEYVIPGVLGWYIIGMAVNNNMHGYFSDEVTFIVKCNTFILGAGLLAAVANRLKNEFENSSSDDNTNEKATSLTEAKYEAGGNSA